MRNVPGRLDGALKGDKFLWYCLLREAEYYGATDQQKDGVAFAGRHLGPVGSRIVAETLIGLLWRDEGSFLQTARGFEPLADLAMTSGRCEAA